LAEFYIGQIKAIHADTRADQGELSALLAKVLKLAQTKKGLSVTAANQAIRAIKTNSHALECFKELESMGYGKVEKDKKSWVFYPIVDIVDTIVDGIVDGSNGNKINTFNPIVDIVDIVDDFAKKENPTSTTGLEGVSTSIPPCQAKNDENHTPVYDVYDSPETLMDKGQSTVDIIVDAPVYDSENVYDGQLKPLKFSFQAGSRISCYPTQRHFDTKREVSATVLEVRAEQGWFLGCTIEYRSKKGTVSTQIAGGCVNWILRKL
jgi:hypothetical protein